MKKFAFCALLLCAFSTLSFAQEDVPAAQEDDYGWSMTVGFDNMTAYNWRGIRQSYHPAGYNVMPNITFNYTGKRFGFEAGIYDMEEARKTWIYDEDLGENVVNRYCELGAWLNVTFAGLKLEAQVYGVDKHLWNKKLIDDHGGCVFDLGLGYTLDVLDWFQPSVSWYTIMAGDDKILDEDHKRFGKQAFSSYLELNMPFYVGDAEIAAVFGANPFYAPYYCHESNGFAVSNLGLNATYTVSFNNGIELPIKLEGGYNFASKTSPELFDENLKGWYFGLTVSFYFTKSL